MKEATGELNMTVIVAISIGILSAFFFGVLWPMIHSNFEKNSQCNKAICDCTKETRESIESESGLSNKCICSTTKSGLTSGDDDDIFYCPFKG